MLGHLHEALLLRRVALGIAGGALTIVDTYRKPSGCEASWRVD